MTNPKIADLTVSQFKELIHDTVAELLTDPDERLVLRDHVAEKLRQSIKEAEAGGKTIPLSELLREVGLPLMAPVAQSLESRTHTR